MNLKHPKMDPQADRAWPAAEPRQGPVLKFSPAAWAKLLYFRDRGDTEIGGFGVTGADDPLCVEEFVSVKQDVSAVTVSFGDQAVADFFDDQVEQGRQPQQFARIWIHSHPGSSPTPSPIDEEVFGRVFGDSNWAVMFVISRTGETYARLRFNTGPGGDVMLQVAVDWTLSFKGSNHEVWEAEHQANVRTVRSTARQHDNCERRLKCVALGG